MSDDDEIEVLDDVIADAMADKSCRENIPKIDPRLNTYYNSINVLVGRQGQGKTFTVLKEIIKISHIDPKTHMLIYVTKDGKSNDATYETLEHLIQLPVIFIAQGDAELFVKSILKWKGLYNQIKSDHLEQRIVADQRQELFESLHITDYRQPWLHTLLFFEDSANNPLFAKPTLYFPQLVAKCRHNGISFFFAVQFWKSLPTELKANLYTIYIFPSYSKQQLHYILSQIPLSETFNAIYSAYIHLGEHQKIVVDAIKGDIKVE
jgi:hypothetical protein